VQSDGYEEPERQPVEGVPVTTAGPFAITLRDDRPSLGELRAALQRWLNEQATDEAASAAVILATHEAAANALEHGGGTVIVRARLDEGAVLVEVHDQGRWQPPVGGDDARGRGLVLIRGLMHSVKIETDVHGTGVLMRRLLGGPSVLAGEQPDAGEAAAPA